MASPSGCSQIPTHTHTHTHTLTHQIWSAGGVYSQAGNLEKPICEWATATNTTHQWRQTRHTINQAGFKTLSLRPRMKSFTYGKALGKDLDLSFSISEEGRNDHFSSSHYMRVHIYFSWFHTLFYWVGNHGSREVKWLIQGPTARKGRSQTSPCACVVPKAVCSTN